MTEQARTKDAAVASTLIARENYKFAELSKRRLPWPEDLPNHLEDPLTFFWNNKKTLYEKAYAEYEKVIHEDLNYRYFAVGAAAVVWRASDNQYTIISGYNDKITPDSPKHCAEMKILEQAKREGYDTVVGIVVVARYQPDESQLPCTTLHPCQACRNLLAPQAGPQYTSTGNSLTWPQMPVVTISIPPNKSVDDATDPYTLLEELHTLSELLKKHEGAVQLKTAK